jgi:hypothetical protein
MFSPAVGPCFGPGCGGVQLDEEEPHFVIVNPLIVVYLLEQLIAS